MTEIARFPAASGPMADKVRAYPWEQTPLGPIQSWPASLRVTVNAVLSSRFAQCVFWGEHLIAIYNDAFVPLLGGKPSALGQPFRVTWNETWDSVAPIVAQALSGEAAFFEDLPLEMDRTGKIETAYFTFCYSPVHDESGRIMGLLDTVVETTDRVMSDRIIAEQQENQRHLLQQMPGFVAVLDGPDHVFTYVNDAYVTISGARDSIGRTVREVFPDLEGQGFFELIDQVYATGERFIASSVPIALVTGLVFVNILYEPIRSADGSITGIFVGGYDVTTAQEANMALKASEERFRSFAQAMPNHAWTAQPNGELDWFNDRVYAYSGVAHDQLVGNGWASLVHPDDIGEAAAAWGRSIATGTIYETQFRIRHRDGLYRWHIVRAVPLRDEAGTVRLWTGTNTDIEEQKLTAAALEHLNSTLEQQVEDRTADLLAAQETLRQAQKMEAVGQLTGGLAHDFNNILAGISGSLQMMQTRIAQGRVSEVDRYVTAALGASKRAASLTQRLLAFSRRQTLDPQPTNLNRLVSGMEDLINRSVGPQIEVETAAAAGLWTTFVDPGQLENALLNLCINARDAMPDGGKLTIETANRWLDDRAATERGLTPGQYISLCVSDTGTGMSDDTIARAFDPFFTTKPIGQGTGLGLSMVYGFAGQSGGSTRIYSEVGQGTMVCIYIPRHVGDADIEEGPDPMRQDLPRGDHTETIMVVDDEPLVRMIVVEQLEELGYAVLEAEDASSALKLLATGPRISLLVTDVGLPGGMNGRQLADAVRQTRADLQVLFITGYAENAVLNHGHLDHGMHVMTKPFATEDLARRVRGLLSDGP